MSEFTKGEWIIMQKNLGLQHWGDILITTQERIDANQEPIAKDIDCRDNANLIASAPKLKQQRDDLLEASESLLETLLGTGYDSKNSSVVEIAEAAIAKAKA